MKDKKPNSISFGPVNYDQGKHLLQVKGKFGKNQIMCSVTEDALKEVYHVQGGEKEFMQSFEQHVPQIQQAVMKKIELKEWKVPEKEILVNEQDLRQWG